MLRSAKTFLVKPHEVERRWYVVDAAGKPAGRLAAGIARVLMGKDKPTYTPHADNGDFVVVVNARKVVFTGRKEEDKTYKRFSGYPGGLKEIPARLMRQRRPEYIVSHAVRGMLPANHLRRRRMRRLKVYAGPDHPHQAQKPEPLPLDV
ncbi:MAG TPA: 50S ribosomal protein L13 [Kiritimatiellae bacterium]|nr:50S ribosomal protein L13 [Kiritimatiellia bacterium]